MLITEKMVYVLFDGISLAMLLVTALFLYLQNRQLSKQTKNMQEQLNKLREEIRSETYYKMSLLTLEIDKLFINKPDYKPYFYEKKDYTNLSEDDRNCLEACAELKLDIYDAWAYLAKNDRIPEVDKNEWLDSVKNGFRSSKLMRDVYEKRKEWYGHRLKKLIEDV
ncbi:MAG: hypothetical protein WC532_00785 [Candidatus Omnitrophota bacterium]